MTVKKYQFFLIEEAGGYARAQVSRPKSSSWNKLRPSTKGGDSRSFYGLQCKTVEGAVHVARGARLQGAMR